MDLDFFETPYGRNASCTGDLPLPLVNMELIELTKFEIIVKHFFLLVIITYYLWNEWYCHEGIQIY